MENQLQEKLEVQVETAIILGFVGTIFTAQAVCTLISKKSFMTLVKLRRFCSESRNQGSALRDPGTRLRSQSKILQSIAQHSILLSLILHKS